MRFCSTEVCYVSGFDILLLLISHKYVDFTLYTFHLNIHGFFFFLHLGSSSSLLHCVFVANYSACCFFCIICPEVLITDSIFSIVLLVKNVYDPVWRQIYYEYFFFKIFKRCV